MGQAERKLGWNHVGDPRAPRARGFVFVMQEVIEMTKSDTESRSGEQWLSGTAWGPARSSEGFLYVEKEHRRALRLELPRQKGD